MLRRGGSRRRHRIDEHADEPGSLGNVPDREGDPAVRGQNARELGGRLLGAADVQQREVRDHGIERPIRKRQRLGVAAAELELGMEPACEREHPLGDVDPDDRRTPFGGRGGHVARSRGHVQHAGAGTDPAASSSGPTSRDVMGTKNSS